VHGVSRTIVEFPNLRVLVTSGGTTREVAGEAANEIGRTDVHESRAATDATTGVSRYTREVVRFNLRLGSCTVAGAVAPAATP
jgi:hypothetical protein